MATSSPAASSRWASPRERFLPLEPMEDPEVAHNDVAVVVGEQLPRGRKAVEPRLGVDVVGQRLIVPAAGELWNRECQA